MTTPLSRLKGLWLFKSDLAWTDAASPLPTEWKHDVADWWLMSSDTARFLFDQGEKALQATVAAIDRQTVRATALLSLISSLLVPVGVFIFRSWPNGLENPEFSAGALLGIGWLGAAVHCFFVLRPTPHFQLGADPRFTLHSGLRMTCVEDASQNERVQFVSIVLEHCQTMQDAIAKNDQLLAILRAQVHAALRLFFLSPLISFAFLALYRLGQPVLE